MQSELEIRKKKVKKNEMEIDETIDEALNSNTSEANPSVDGSGSTRVAINANPAEPSPDAGGANKDGIGGERQNLSADREFCRQNPQIQNKLDLVCIYRMLLNVLVSNQLEFYQF